MTTSTAAFARRFAILLALALPFALPADDSRADEYYVDSLLGNDADSGDRPDAPWKSLKRVNDAELKPGDSVLFRRGRVWRGMLRAKQGAENAPITYAAYGKGEKPRIMSSVDLADPALWTRVDDDLWATPAESFEDAPGALDPELSKIGTGEWFVYTEETARATCVRKRFEEFDADGYALKVGSSSTEGSYLQLTTQDFGVKSGHCVALRVKARASKPVEVGTTVPKLMMRGAPWSAYGTTLAAPETLDEKWREFDIVFDITETADDGRITLFLGGRVPDDATIEFAILGVREVKFNSLGLGADVGNLVLTPRDATPKSTAPETKRFLPTWDRRERAAFKKWTLDEVQALDDFMYDVNSYRVYLRCDANPGEKFASIEAVLRPHCCRSEGTDVVFDGLAFTHTGAHGISVVNGKRIVVRNCDFDWIGGGDLGGGGASGKRVRFGNGVEFWDGVDDGLVENCRFSRIYDVATTTQGGGNDVVRNLIIRNNVVFRCEQAFEIWFDSPKTVMENVRFEGNICVDSGREWSHIQRPNKIATPILGYQLSAGKVDVVVRKNVFCGTAQYFIKLWHDRVAEYAIDDNVYWNDGADENGGKYFGYDAIHKKPDMTYEEFRAATGHDAHSRWVEPKFRDYEKDDFEILNRNELFPNSKNAL